MKVNDILEKVVLINNGQDVVLKWDEDAREELAKYSAELKEMVIEAIPKAKAMLVFPDDIGNPFNWGYESALSDVRKKLLKLWGDGD